MRDAKNKSPLPTYSPELGQDQQGINRFFILVEQSKIPKATFLSFEGSLVRFDTLADAKSFCKMANASFISFPYTTK
ncbi:hypothetical protein UFOVP779_13 [uncultured Caudovirales phage]|uniref:Uncharacterized protein n=1 Tax=uncultured Caudovirales phage TaxID=2100421 RepID=A0A6J5NYI6_9CAUD|nr:hypothetical protein UFOVP779_13 [uncultured Caudovirales phage]